MTIDESETPETTETNGGERSPNGADPTLLDQLTDHVVTLETVDPSASYNDLEPLHDRLDDADVIGLGEASHGAREFFQMKDRLIRYLVTECDVDAIALEANFTETLLIDDYVVHGRGDPRDALDAIPFWTWEVESVLEMIEWLRSFNANRPMETRVRFFGIDSHDTRGPTNQLLGFLEDVDADFLGSVRDDLETIADGMKNDLDDDAVEQHHTTVDTVMGTIRDRLEARKETYVDASSEFAWEFARQHLRILQQAVEDQRIRQLFSDDDVDMTTAKQRLKRVRDRSLADNVDWVLNRDDTDKVVIWAHDNHITRAETTLRGVDETVPTMGSHLAERHGEDYWALGFSLGHGSFQARTVNIDAKQGDEGKYGPLKEHTLDAPLPNTIDAALAELGYPVMILDVTSAVEQDRLNGWLSEPQRHFSVGSMYTADNPEMFVIEYVYANAFDGVCYIDETTRARPLQRDESG